MDTNNDGAFDIIVGVPSSGDCATVDCVGVYIYDNAENLSPGYRYSGTRLNYAVSFHCNPSMSCQDLEFTLDNWSKIPGLRTNPYEWRFGFEAFAGSFTDGGIGEDFMVAPQNIQARFICPSQLDVMFNPFPEVRRKKERERGKNFLIFLIFLIFFFFFFFFFFLANSCSCSYSCSWSWQLLCGRHSSRL